MVTTKAAAELCAKELKCSAAFAMGKDGMPGRNLYLNQKTVSKLK